MTFPEVRNGIEMMRGAISRGYALICGFLALCALFGVLAPSPAQARRTALIIGNAAYEHSKVLVNPINDAELIADSATKAGFEVIMATDLNRATFDQALREFRARADGAEVALIYYAGHGIESGGTNWLVPIDAKLTEIRDLRFEAVDLNALLETLGDAQRRIVILDACRDNPFGSNWSIGVRATQRGLAQTPIEGALIIYAASQGQVAIDGTGTNSPFATAVAKRIAEPGLILQLLGPKVTDDVLAATKGRQRPWTYSGMGGEEFFLVPGLQVAGSSLKAAEPRAGDNASGAYSYQADSYAWRYADTKNTVPEYEDYLSKFPSGVFAQNARERLEKLRSAGAAKLASAVPAGRRPRDTARAGAKDVPAVTRGTMIGTGTGAFADAFKGAPAAGDSAAVVQPDARKNPPPVSAASATAAAAMLTANRVTDLAPLPAMPAAPEFPMAAYPDCREGYQAVQEPNGRVGRINSCLTLLNAYSVNVLNAYRASMAQHQSEISRLYTEQVGGQDKYSDASQRQFYQAMMKEFADSDPAGPRFASYREAEDRYKNDRAYLDDRYCFSTGSCGGYPVPPGISQAGK